MVHIEDILDEESFKAWLRQERLSEQDMIVLAHRAAMRVLPVWWYWVDTSAPKTGYDKITLLPVLRCLIISNISALGSVNAQGWNVQPENRNIPDGDAKTAESAAHSAYQTTQKSDNRTVIQKTAVTVNISGRAISGSETAIWQELCADCRLLKDQTPLMNAPLWNDSVNPLDQKWQAIYNKYPPDDDHPFVFWVDWYQRALDGKETRSDVLRQVAFLQDQDWQKGLEKLAPVIADFERQHWGAVEESAARAHQSVKDSDEIVQKFNQDISDLRDNLEQAQKEADEKRSELFAKLEQDVTQLKQALESDIVLKDSVKLWGEKRATHEETAKTAWWWFRVLLGVTGLVSVALVSLVGFVPAITTIFYPPGCDLITAPYLCQGLSTTGILAIGTSLTVLTLCFWGARIKMKEFLSERHLALDAQERHAFIRAYIALLEAGHITGQNRDEAQIVFQALFRPTQDGIVKDDGVIDPSVSAMLGHGMAR